MELILDGETKCSKFITDKDEEKNEIILAVLKKRKSFTILSGAHTANNQDESHTPVRLPY